MSGSFGKSNSNSNSNQGFNQNVWSPQGSALKNLYGELGGLAQGTIGQSAKGNNKAGNAAGQGVMTPMANSMQNNMNGGAYQGMDLQRKLANSLEQNMNTPSATSKIYADIMGGQGNNYADAMKQSYINDANRAQDNMLSNLDARAAAAGMSGGSRHGVATALGMRDINQNLQNEMAQTGYNTFNQDLQNKLDIAKQADSNTLQREQMMQQMIGGEQGAMNQGYNQGLQLGNYGQGVAKLPWQQAQMYGSIIGGPQVLSNGFGNSNANSKALALSGGAK